MSVGLVEGGVLNFIYVTTIPAPSQATNTRYLVLNIARAPPEKPNILVPLHSFFMAREC